MPYIPTYERKAHEEGFKIGFEQGRQEAYEKGFEEGRVAVMLELIALELEEKFGRRGLKMLKPIRELGVFEKLCQFARHLKKAKSLAEVRTFSGNQVGKAQP